MSSVIVIRLAPTLLVSALPGLAGCEPKPVFPASPLNKVLGEVVAEATARWGGPGAKNAARPSPFAHHVAPTN
ncbi:hypothetical protein LBMAG56_03660 [Verrucomicrobiota bacterium]|nr:hypothetical protein LBMAG56_03660 [Verrucomicrobiota bacterium]